MNGWLDWREIEKQNDWGLREQTDAMGEMWDEGSQMWDRRWKGEEEFTKRQADALELLPSDTVLDIGCGTGPLTINVAPRVRKVIAQDYGHEMLALLRQNAQERGLTNVETLQGNWHTMEPGVDLPICDVAITRWSPAQGNILKFSRCATRRCYSLSTCAPRFEKDGFSTGGFWCRSTTDDRQNRTPRPCARKYGFNVHFNLLYDHGANPTINYVEQRTDTRGATREELLEKLHAERVPADMRERLERGARQEEDGTWVFTRRMVMTVMGWDPRDVQYDE